VTRSVPILADGYAARPIIRRTRLSQMLYDSAIAGGEKPEGLAFTPPVTSARKRWLTWTVRCWVVPRDTYDTIAASATG
jgi:hypothetical protein